MKNSLFIILIFFSFACNSQSDVSQQRTEIDSLALQLNDAAFEKYRNYVSGIDRDKRNLETAVVELDQAIDLEPEVALFYSTKSHILLTLGKHEEAIAELKKIIAFQPYNAEELSMIGFIYERYDNPIEARKWYEKSIEAYEMRIADDVSVINSELHLAFLKFFVEDERVAIRTYHDLKESYPSSDQVLFMERLFTDFDRDRFLQELHE